MYIVGRPINGISINGLEFILDENDEEMKFDTQEDAIGFVVAHGGSRDDFDEGSLVMLEAETGTVC